MGAPRTLQQCCLAHAWLVGSCQPTTPAGCECMQQTAGAQSPTLRRPAPQQVLGTQIMYAAAAAAAGCCVFSSRARGQLPGRQLPPHWNSSLIACQPPCPNPAAPQKAARQQSSAELAAASAAQKAVPTCHCWHTSSPVAEGRWSRAPAQACRQQVRCPVPRTRSLQHAAAAAAATTAAEAAMNQHHAGYGAAAYQTAGAPRLLPASAPCGAAGRWLQLSTG